MNETIFVIGGCRSGKSRHALETAEKVKINGLKIACGCDQALEQPRDSLNAVDLAKAMEGNLEDMNRVAAELSK